MIAGTGYAQTQGAGASTQRPAEQPSRQTEPLDTREFINQMTIAGLAEVQLGEMAQQRGQHGDVKNFAERMVRDHTKANEELARIAKQLNVQPPSALDAKHKELADSEVAPLDAVARSVIDLRILFVNVFGVRTLGGGWVLMARKAALYPRKPIDISARVQELPPDGVVPQLSDWRWVHTPGHTAGHVALFRDADRALIAGDAFCTTARVVPRGPLSGRYVGSPVRK